MLLVTGITGHSGGYFLQELVAHSYKTPIRCIVRSTSDTAALDKSGLNIEKVYGDLNDPDFINYCMQDVEVVVHIYNIHHSVHMVQAAIENKVKRIILVHTTGIYSKFKNASQAYKDIEKKIAAVKEEDTSKLQVVILRPTMIYGDLCDRNMSKFIKLLDRFKIIPVIDQGRSLIQPVNARDLGKAFYEVLMAPERLREKSYILSGEKPLELREAFEMICKELKRKPLFVNVSLNAGIFGAGVLKILSLGKLDFVERVQRMGEDRSYSHATAFRDFGYRPMTFLQGIQMEVKEYLNRKEK